MPWPDQIVHAFQKVSVNPSEVDFHGPYNKLLYTLFPGNTDYIVTWHYMPNSWEAEGAILFYEVWLEDEPVLVLALTEDLKDYSTSWDADQQIRRRLQDLWDECPFPVLYGVSAIETRLCFYKKHHEGLIEPPLIRYPEVKRYAALRNRWDCDIFDDEGERRFLSMVKEIKQACAAAL